MSVLWVCHVCMGVSRTEGDRAITQKRNKKKRKKKRGRNACLLDPLRETKMPPCPACYCCIAGLIVLSPCIHPSWSIFGLFLMSCSPGTRVSSRRPGLIRRPLSTRFHVPMHPTTLLQVPHPVRHHHLLKSRLPRTLLSPSRLGRTELLELRRRRARCSPGSVGCRPLDRAKTFRMSVSEMTPVSLPERCAPGIAAAGTEDDGEKMGFESGRGDGGAEDWL